MEPRATEATRRHPARVFPTRFPGSMGGGPEGLLEGPPDPYLKFTRWILGQVDDPRSGEPADGEMGQVGGNVEERAQVRHVRLAPLREEGEDAPREKI